MKTGCSEVYDIEYQDNETSNWIWFFGKPSLQEARAFLSNQTISKINNGWKFRIVKIETKRTVIE